ncbi:class III extradiol ring-cleavage dioxygenase [Mesorhizobium sp. J428]|uniref:DODA-type extradiol aromatic ring-opening family dioxygenase n=1 Tax=Mesorhizobium sp. J428 TaxID=2898440 RepID=UPI002151F7CC|nr:class III extradiol ring-cleavage dioxygenase [Mesorhizobium sp. J428]MCR5860275.1 dioxygenase [Mesorhizobium sp. J428]
MTRMPTVFIPHGGGPCFFMDWNPPDEWDRHRQFLQSLPGTLPDRPKALLVISGHWEERAFTVQTNPAPPLLFDYGGFPPHTYELSWPAPGDPVLADRVHHLIRAAGLPAAKDAARGFDHGAFVPLKVAFPDADFPCVQLSLASDLDPGRHIALGQALAPLRDEGVLIIGSGNTYHNMGVMMRSLRGGPRGDTVGGTFDAWLTEAVTCPDAGERNRRLTYWSKAPGGRDAHPREEHLIPLHVIAGAAGADIGRKTLDDHVLGAVESAFRFG